MKLGVNVYSLLGGVLEVQLEESGVFRGERDGVLGPLDVQLAVHGGAEQGGGEVRLVHYFQDIDV